MTETDYIDAQETADLIRRPASTLAYWRHRGEGPRYAKVGRRVLYRRSDVLAWLESQFEGSARKAG